MNSKSLVIILCILASVLVVWQLVLPVYDKITAINQEIGQAQKKVKKLEELEAKLKELAQVYKDKEPSISKLYKIMPNSKDVPEILNRFEALSFQSGVILNSLDFAEAEEGKKAARTAPASDQEGAVSAGGTLPAGQEEETPVKTLTLGFKISGTYDAFRGFLDNLENCVRLADVQKISFAFSGEGGDLADFNITANVYYR
ncbi:MAG: hypothetical protein UT31_C0006G0007 [Parcubacteria group bacterium GW2011_GWF2_39_13b]|nr:MAG: hypothetical protein UT31_C0006G0007 [Parcubacteria group bacterium GW2011_GWF2_39_13b]